MFEGFNIKTEKTLTFVSDTGAKKESWFGHGRIKDI